MNATREFTRELKARLADYADDAVLALNRFLRRKRPGVTRIAFEVHFDDERIPIVGYPQNDDDPTMFFGGETPFRKRLFTRRETRAYVECDVETLELAAPITRDWFRRVWNRSDGVRFPIPASVMLHDDIQVFPLKTAAPREKKRGTRHSRRTELIRR